MSLQDRRSLQGDINNTEFEYSPVTVFEITVIIAFVRIGTKMCTVYDWNISYLKNRLVSALWWTYCVMETLSLNDLKPCLGADTLSQPHFISDCGKNRKLVNLM